MGSFGRSGMPAEIAGYRERGRDAHATKKGGSEDPPASVKEDFQGGHASSHGRVIF